MSTMTIDMARRIEREAGLAMGSIAVGREMSMAEETFLNLPPHPTLALHVELGGSPPTLVLFEQEIGIGTKKHLEGAQHATPQEALKEVEQLWASLVLARQNGLEHVIGEDVAVAFTGWTDRDNGAGERWSWSVIPSRIRDIFSCSPASMLLLPHFEDWAPEYEGKRSPGKFISRLGVQQVLLVHSIVFQGATTMKNWSSNYILQRARYLADETFGG